MLSEKIQKLGLTKKEAQVYLALLESDSSLVSKIAKKTGIKRSTVYVVLDSLLDRKLVNITKGSGAKLYNPAPLEKLIQHFKESAKEQNELADVARKLLPELKSLRKESSQPKPKIEFFDGSKGMETVYENMLTSLEDIRAYASGGKETKKAKDIKVQVMLPKNLKDREQIAKTSKEHSFSPEISVYDNKIVLVSPTEEFAITIESPELSKALRKVFELSTGNPKKKLFGKPAKA